MWEALGVRFGILCPQMGVDTGEALELPRCEKRAKLLNIAAAEFATVGLSSGNGFSRPGVYNPNSAVHCRKPVRWIWAGFGPGAQRTARELAAAILSDDLCPRVGRDALHEVVEFLEKAAAENKDTPKLREQWVAKTMFTLQTSQLQRPVLWTMAMLPNMGY